MQIKKINILNLRNHSTSHIVPNNDLNIFFGPNGTGKTTVLEAISIGCLTKTFTSTPDLALIKEDENSYFVQIEAKSHLDLPYKVDINYFAGQKKRISNTFGENQNPKDIIGIIPLVYLSPDQKDITIGSPENRREFIDRILAQSSKTFLDTSLKFRKALKQRNSLLSSFKRNETFDEDSYSSWTDLFIELAVKIVQKRNEFLEEFKPIFKQVYSEITNDKEQVDLIYEPHSIDLSNLTDSSRICEQFENKSKLRLGAELSRGITLFGPQKDEIKILLNGSLSKERASQGQHKSLLISLIFAEFEYLMKIKNETPIVLLDDIFSELDEMRSSLVLERVLERKAQTFITLTNLDLISRKELLFNKVSYFKLEDGKIHEIQ